jgi:hypothetical protein
LIYYQGAEDDYVEIQFDVNLYPQESGATYTPVFGDHQIETYFVNVNPETEE